MYFVLVFFPFLSQRGDFYFMEHILGWSKSNYGFTFLKFAVWYSNMFLNMVMLYIILMSISCFIFCYWLITCCLYLLYAWLYIFIRWLNVRFQWPQRPASWEDMEKSKLTTIPLWLIVSSLSDCLQSCQSILSVHRGIHNNIIIYSFLLQGLI